MWKKWALIFLSKYTLHVQPIKFHCYAQHVPPFVSNVWNSTEESNKQLRLDFLRWSTLVSATLCVSLWPLPAHSLLFDFYLCSWAQTEDRDTSGTAHFQTTTMRHKYILVNPYGRLLPFGYRSILSIKLLQPLSTACGLWSRQTADQLFSIGSLADGKQLFDALSHIKPLVMF